MQRRKQNKQTEKSSLLWRRNMSALENPWGTESVCERICGHDFRGPFPWPLVLRRAVRSPLSGHAASLHCLVWMPQQGQQNVCWLSPLHSGSSSRSEDVIWWWIESVTQQGDRIQLWISWLLGISSLFQPLWVYHPVSCKRSVWRRNTACLELDTRGGDSLQSEGQ